MTLGPEGQVEDSTQILQLAEDWVLDLRAELKVWSYRSLHWSVAPVTVMENDLVSA